MAEDICCPQCGSKKNYKDGIRCLADNRRVQRWLCRDCGYRFSDPNHKGKVDFSYGGKVQKTAPSRLNESSMLSYGCQVGASRQSRAKNLVRVETRQSRAAGAKQRTSKADMKVRLVDYSWFQKKEGYKESTIISRTRRLKRLIKLGADLYDPESVKEVISKQSTWSSGFKEAVVDAYSSFLRMQGLTWNPPRYMRTRKLPFIPNEAEINALIAGCGKKTAAFLQALKETAMRPGEACQLQWIDLDPVNHTLRLNAPEKGSNPRIWRISTKLVKILNNLPKTSNHIFGESSLRSKRCNYSDQRRRMADKLQNPRLVRIKFQTFRHWKATMEYNRTKDILHVMKFLGHRNIKNTLVYTQLLPQKDDEFVVKVARTLEDAKTLLECGFEYVTDMDDYKLFRKHK